MGIFFFFFFFGFTGFLKGQGRDSHCVWAHCHSKRREREFGVGGSGLGGGGVSGDGGVELTFQERGQVPDQFMIYNNSVGGSNCAFFLFCLAL